MKNIGNYFLLLLLCCGFAVNAQEVEMADSFRSEGKIYVVVAIVLIVLTGLIVYLFVMDKKLSRMEKAINDKQKTK